MPIDRGMDKEDVVHVCNATVFSHETEQTGPFASGMDGLETITQSKVSQKGKHKHHVLTHICGI